MPKFLVKASFTQQGVQGLIKEGGTGRREAIGKLAASMGASMEAFYFAFGETDVYVIFDAPDNETMAAASLAVGASGAAGIETVVLITPEEIDAASKKQVDYRPPGA